MAKYGEHSSAWELGQTGGGGRGGGPWLGPLAAGEGEGSPGGGCKDESRRQVGPPSLPLAHGHMQDSLSRNTPVGRGTNTGAHR